MKVQWQVIQNKLRHAAEPSLAERLYTIFSTLPLPFDNAGLRLFCKECQDRRNDVSHFGGLRHKNRKYNEFVRDLDRKSDALAALYQLHLLTVIGVSTEQLDLRHNQNWPLSRMQTHLRLAGILQNNADDALISELLPVSWAPGWGAT